MTEIKLINDKKFVTYNEVFKKYCTNRNSILIKIILFFTKIILSSKDFKDFIYYFY